MLVILIVYHVWELHPTNALHVHQEYIYPEDNACSVILVVRLAKDRQQIVHLVLQENIYWVDNV